MISKIGKLNLLLKELAISVGHRKLLQKAVYVLIEMGLLFRYHFVWYSDGVYCSELADDADELQIDKDLYDSEIKKYQFTQKYQEIINKYKDIFGRRQSDLDWINQVCVFLFLQKNEKISLEEVKNIILQRGFCDPCKVEGVFYFVKQNFISSSMK